MTYSTNLFDATNRECEEGVDNIVHIHSTEDQAVCDNIVALRSFLAKLYENLEESLIPMLHNLENKNAFHRYRVCGALFHQLEEASRELHYEAILNRNTIIEWAKAFKETKCQTQPQ